MRMTTDHQFALGIRHGAADQRVLRQNIQCSNYVADALPWIFHFMIRQMIKNALEILGDFRRQFDTGHAQRTSLRATGLFVALPAKRASR